MCHPCHTTNKHDNNILMMIITRYLQTWMVPEVKNKQKTKKKNFDSFSVFGRSLFWSIQFPPSPPLSSIIIGYFYPSSSATDNWITSLRMMITVIWWRWRPWKKHSRVVFLFLLFQVWKIFLSVCLTVTQQTNIKRLLLLLFEKNNNNNNQH